MLRTPAQADDKAGGTADEKHLLLPIAVSSNSNIDGADDVGAKRTKRPSITTPGRILLSNASFPVNPAFIWKNLTVEGSYFWHHKHIYAMCIFYLVYFASMANRNLAYYRHVPGDTLKDIGFEYIPEIPLQYRFLSELVMIASCVVGGFCLLTVLVIDQSHLPRKVRLMSVATRTLCLMVTGHFFRALTFLSTSLPGTAPHCKIDSPHYSPPTTLTEVFWTRWSSSADYNCGDLLYSGHMFQGLIFAILACKYTRIVYSRKWHLIASTFVMGLMPIQAMLIIASRNHYTVDVVVAIYFCFTLFFTCEYLFPNDLYLENVERKAFPDLLMSVTANDTAADVENPISSKNI